MIPSSGTGLEPFRANLDEDRLPRPPKRLVRAA
jgi:hypothetical protein